MKRGNKEDEHASSSEDHKPPRILFSSVWMLRNLIQREALFALRKVKGSKGI